MLRKRLRRLQRRGSRGQPSPVLKFCIWPWWIIAFSYNLIPPAKWDDFVKERFGLCAAMSWPLGGKESLRIAADWLILLFKYDDLLDDASSNLMRNESSATKASKIFISAIANTENFQPVLTLPIATACHEWVDWPTSNFLKFKGFFWHGLALWPASAPCQRRTCRRGS